MARNYSYRNLLIWQRVQELAMCIIHLVERMPHSWANAVLVRQVESAATSIGANIAEGHGRYTPGAHRNHLSIAKGSAAETDSWIDLMRRTGWITSDEESDLHATCVELMTMLTSKILDLEAVERKSGGRMREANASYIASDDQPSFPFTADDYQDT